MNNIATLYPNEAVHYCGPASVIDFADGDDALRIRLLNHHEQSERVARLTTQLVSFPEAGDEVLVTGDVYGELYVIGLLTSQRQPRKLAVGGGAYAVVDDASASPLLKVYSKRHELLIEFDPESEKARVNIDSGDLEFTTNSGDIVLNSANNIQLNAENIELAGRSGVQLDVHDSIGQLASSFTLNACKAGLSSSKLALTAKLAELQLSETRFSASKFRGTITDAQLVADRVSTVANTVLEKARNAYRTVEKLSQLKTGRMRTLVADSYHLKSKKTTMKSQDDFKVNADKIHLG